MCVQAAASTTCASAYSIIIDSQFNKNCTCTSLSKKGTARAMWAFETPWIVTTLLYSRLVQSGYWSVWVWVTLGVTAGGVCVSGFYFYLKIWPIFPSDFTRRDTSRNGSLADGGDDCRCGSRASASARAGYGRRDPSPRRAERARVDRIQQVFALPCSPTHTHTDEPVRGPLSPRALLPPRGLTDTAP